MELEEAKEILEDYAYASCVISSATEKDKKISKAIEAVLQALENEKSKINKCVETINSLKAGEYIEGSKRYFPSLCCNARLDVIEKILENPNE